MVEGILSLSIGLFTFGTILILWLKLCAWTFLSFDSYLLARAHLYSQRQNVCKVSKYWPSNNFIKVHYQCDFRGRLTVQSSEIARIQWNLPL